jgi:hypothetical protein
MTQLHSAEDAIKQAVEAGYKCDQIAHFKIDNAAEKLIRWGKLPEALQSAAFWQALGKARGWEQKDKASERMWLASGSLLPMPRGMHEWYQLAT